MKIAFILGAFSIGTRPLDFNDIWTSGRGLTGTDLCFVKTAQELKARGHDMHLFTVHKQPVAAGATWEGINLYNFDDRTKIVDDSFDCIISLNEPNVLIGMTQKPLRIVWQMLNDFSFVQPGFDQWVDKYFGVCDEHTQYLKERNPGSHKWATLSLGCTPEWYTDKRVPGRVIWCSSADRGLHWLLSEWPKIKTAVPYATLKIFYHFNYGHVDQIEFSDPKQHPHVKEMAQRVRYIQHVVEKLKPLGVEHVGSISREQMKEEFSRASVFGFSCDTVSFSEGFSVATLEAHASYTVPVITNKDCLGSVYKDSGAIIIESPIQNNLSQFSDSVIRGLTDQEFANNVIAKCRKFAEANTWANAAAKLEQIISKGK